jgi:HD-GYP domain-containing protein (c-di-GMP phosphodiesterase class II)
VRDLASDLRLLNEAGRAMHTERELGPLLARILSLVDQVFHVDTCALLLRAPDGILRIACARGYVEEVVRSFRGAPGQGITGWVADHGEALYVADVWADPRYIGGVPGAVSEIAAPLRLNGTVIGVLDAELKRAGAFDEAHVELFSAFAAHAATAIHNARLLERLERRAADLTLLTRCGRELSSSLDLSIVLDRVLTLADGALRFERCAVLLRDDEGLLAVRAAHGYTDDVIRDLRIRPGEGVTGAVFATGKPELVADVARDPRYIRGSQGGGSELAVPLVLDGEVIGVLDAESTTANAFDDYQLELASAFALMAATALQNARFHARLEAKVKRLGLLSQCSRALSLTLNVDELLEEVLRLSNEALCFERCAVLLTSKDGLTLTLRAAHGYKAELVGTTTLKVGEGVTGTVARTGQARLVADVTKEPGYVEGVRGGRCEMAAPLVARGRVIGVLDAESTKAGAFTAADLELCATFALSAAAAIHNAELYGELDRANATLRHNLVEITRMNRELSDFSAQISSANRDLERRVHELLTLQEASRTITSSLDLDETLMAIVRMAREIVRSSTSAIKLIDDESHELHVRAVDHSEGFIAADLRSLVTAPLRIGERTIGVFELGSFAVDAFSEEDRRMLETLASQAAIAIENARLFESTQATYFETIRSLAYALEARDSYTRGHSERVTKLALRVAEALGLSVDERQIIEHAGMLHDIGKIGVADAILNKPHILSAEDRKIIENHPLFGGTILAPLRFLETVQVLVRHHHERYDGAGYPDHLVGERIPLGARIIAVCDSYDAMTSDRPYRKALSHAAAIDEIRAKRGAQFDPRVVDVFLQLTAPPAAAPGEASV